MTVTSSLISGSPECRSPALHAQDVLQRPALRGAKAHPDGVSHRHECHLGDVLVRDAEDRAAS
jgi:hypothetical protein